MKKLLALICLYGFLETARSPIFGAEILVDKVMAIVNGRPIFHSDIQRKQANGPLVMVSEYPANKDAQPSVRALNDAVNLELIIGAAKDLDIEVSDSDLDNEISRYLEEQKISKDKLIEILQHENESLENYRRDFKNQMLLRRFQRRVIAPSIKITDKDIETYYLSQSGVSANDMIEIVLKQLIIKIDSSMSKDLMSAKRALAADIYAKLKAGLEFNDAIGLYSDDTSSKKPENRQLVLKIKDLSPNLRGALETLKPGEMTTPISTPNGIIIFQLVEKRIGENRDFSAKKEKLEQELRMFELSNQTNKWIADQLQRVTIRKIDE